MVAAQKYYAVDNGFRRANSPQTTPDVGHRLENAVFLDLRRRGGTVAYAGEKDLWECDFVTESDAIQVCAELTPFNREREFTGVLKAVALPGKTRRARILTLNQRDRMTVNGAAIEVQPVWDWLMRKN